MVMKYAILAILLFNFSNALRNSSCSSNDRNSSQTCLQDSELCCGNECLKIDETCSGFSDDEVWALVVFVLSALTDVGQIIIAIWYHKVFFYRLTWTEDNEGFSHRHGFKYMEDFTNWVTRGYLGRKKFRGKSLDDITSELGLWLCMFGGLTLGFLQRLLDLPYIDISMFKILLGDGCNSAVGEGLKEDAFSAKNRQNFE